MQYKFWSFKQVRSMVQLTFFFETTEFMKQFSSAGIKISGFKLAVCLLFKEKKKIAFTDPVGFQAYVETLGYLAFSFLLCQQQLCFYTEKRMSLKWLVF